MYPFISAYLLKGAFSTMFMDLRNDDTEFFNYFQMSISAF